jgi:hypothetical protein
VTEHLAHNVTQNAEYVRCHAGQDGDCYWPECPQVRDGEPVASGRHCPLDVRECEFCWPDAGLHLASCPARHIDGSGAETS